MASFRTGFKIFGEISLKQGLGRIRSFSEDRKPGQWLPEDQWAVRQPGSTCPDPCAKPKKPSKPSKSWLSLCKDPDPPKDPECDIRHNNCPAPVRTDAPWYSLEKLIPKKKPEKTPSLNTCREEMRRKAMFGEDEEVCECIQDKSMPASTEPEPPECCMPKEPCPAPVINLSCPLPKELDLMLWCGKPSLDCMRIATRCQSDRLPYREFKPPKTWKPPPFSLPTKFPLSPSPRCCPGSVLYEEFKHVDVPKPLYTRYKSVELCDSNLLLCMTEVQCPDDNNNCLGIKPLPPPPPPCTFVTAKRCCPKPEEAEGKEKLTCPEKPVIEAASCKPVKIKKGTKYFFRPKPTKLIERRVYKNPLANKKCDFRPPEKEKSEAPVTPVIEKEKPKTLTTTITHEPQTYDGRLPMSNKPPRWMYALCKPGSEDTPLVPCGEKYPEEPDWRSETDGLKFYDNNNGNIRPKPPPDPCLAKKTETTEKTGKTEKTEKEAEKPPPSKTEKIVEPPVYKFKNRFVLMPESYNIKNMRGDSKKVDDGKSFEKFIEVQAAATLKTSKSYPPIKENILYDLQRLCPNPPVDPSVAKSMPRKPPEPECPEPVRFYRRRFSTFTPSALGKLCPIQLYKTPRRTECGDTSDKCKPGNLVPKPKVCPQPKPRPDCAEIALPCCPRAHVPPDCDRKRPMPICKKKLPPKPSFSECSKDPPPCPRMTECDAWDRKGKKRFSDWAIKRAEFDERQLEKDSKEPLKMDKAEPETKPEQTEIKENTPIT